MDDSSVPVGGGEGTLLPPGQSDLLGRGGSVEGGGGPVQGRGVVSVTGLHLRPTTEDREGLGWIEDQGGGRLKFTPLSRILLP